MTPRLQFADVRGARLAWNSTGKGSPVVWAHGMGSSAYSAERAGHFDWRPISARHRLLRVNARGHGRSGGGTSPAEYSWPELARDLMEVLDHVDDPPLAGAPVAGIGASMGTATLLHAALANPGRFSRLVLTCPPTMGATRAAQMPDRLAQADLVERAGLSALPVQTVADLPPALADGRPMSQQVSARRLPAVLRGSVLSDLPSAEQLAALDIPVLALSWTGDPGHPVESGEWLASVLPQGQLRVAATPAELHAWTALVVDFLAD